MGPLARARLALLPGLRPRTLPRFPRNPGVPMPWTAYRKALVAALGAALTAALGVVPPDSTLWQVLTVASAALTAAAVYAVPNTPPAGPAGVVAP